MALIVPRPKAPTGEVTFETLLNHFNADGEECRLRRTLPAEWWPQSGVQLTWPHAATDWAYMLDEVVETYVHLAYEIAVREPLLIVTPEPDAVRSLLARRLPEQALRRIAYFECPTNDTWARDHGFITVYDTDGPQLLDFRFNGWGGKFEAALDNAINVRLVAPDALPESVVSAAASVAPAATSAAQPSCAAAPSAEGSAGPAILRGRYTDCLDFELEGGAIESDGQGTLLTTAECLLNTNRRHEGDAVPVLEKTQVEMLLCERLGVERVLWLDHGYLAGDDTDSHIDTLARLCPDNTIVYVRCTDPDDEHYAALTQMEQQLQTFRTADDQPYRLIPVPLPRACYDEDGERLPATYANFLIMNDAVLLPVYDQPDLDDEAVRQLQKAFPRHEIVTVDCRSLIRQHGSLHCCTMQFPRGVMQQPEPKAE